MRYVRSAYGVLAFAALAACVACGGADPDPTGSDESQLNNGGLGATGDACTIDLPDGLKVPGKENAKGQCCNIFHEDECYDKPTPTPAQTGVNRIGGSRGGGARR